MAANYIDLPITTDADDLSADALDLLIQAIPGWTPQEGHLEVWLIEVLARMEAETRDVASRIPTSIFRYFGKSLMGIPAIDAGRASVETTWTVVDASGYTIPAGTVVAYSVAGDQQVYFEVSDDVVVAPGSTSTATGEVVLRALEAGSAANDLEGAQFSVVDALAYVTGITAEGPTSGGVDAETDDEYLDRLRDELRLLAPRPILPDDFATLAIRITGVERAIAVDGYNPADGTYNNERMIAVAVADEAGHGVSPTIKAAVDSYLQSLREVNFVVNIIDPTITTVDVTATIKVLDTYNTDDVIAAVEAALQNYLTPATWSWASVLRYNELIALISDVPGVDYVADLTQPNSNVTLPGVAALIQAGTISIESV
jgi:uncharacterized phage protein gp47/JayE